MNRGIWGINQDMNLENIKNTYGSALTFWGGISTQRALPQQTPAGIRETTRALLAAFPEGGLIAGPTHAAPGDIPPENIEAMLQVLRGR